MEEKETEAGEPDAARKRPLKRKRHTDDDSESESENENGEDPGHTSLDDVPLTLLYNLRRRVTVPV